MKGWKKLNLNKKYFIYLLVVLGGLLPIIFNGNEYLILIFCTIGITAISVSGLDILFGYSGQISLGHAAFYAIGAYTSAILSRNIGLSVWISILMGALLATIIAILLAIPTVKLVHHFLALVTISFGQVVYLFVSNVDKLTGGYEGMNFIPPPQMGSFIFSTNISYFYIIYSSLLIFIIIKDRIVKSRIGRAFISIRENSYAASGSGVNVRYYKVMAFAISAFFTGFAGALYAHFIGFISPETFVFSQSILFLIMLLMGGMGDSIAGPIIGVIFITIISEYLQQIGSSQTLFYGIIILLLIIFLPNGLYGSTRGFYELIHEKKVVKNNAKVE